MSCSNCNNKGHNKKKYSFGISASASSSHAAVGTGPRASLAAADGPRASLIAAAGPRPSPAPVDGPRASPAAADGPRLSPAPAIGPRSIPTAGARSKPAAPTGRGRGRPKGSIEKDCAASRRRIIRMGLLHTQSGATIINPRISSERFINVKSSAFVTGGLGYRPTSGVKWKEKQVMTSSKLQEMKIRKQIVQGPRLHI